MRRLSLKTHILVAAVLWTIGLFAITGVILHVVTFDHSSTHVATHSSAQFLSYWTFSRHAPVAALVGVVFMLLGFLALRRGLSPINELRNRLVAVHKGLNARVGGSYPAEVQPLVDDLNALLEDRERRVARGVAKAGDLAHGLKTPLAVLAHEAEQVRAVGHEQLATEIDQQIDRMRRQIDYHLAHARSTVSTVSPAAHASIAASAAGLVRALKRLHAERDLRIEIDAPSSRAFRGPREDLDEMLGNLLDNSCKWAHSQVMLTCSKEGRQVVITVDDDGPGIEPSMREAVLRRGIRADEGEHGSGLGLAIVRDLAEIYGGSISLDDSPLGGLRARLTLPAQDAA
ncbi:MAG TPA: ATP-binding protein [Pyrinomonadaceae bacterium]|jgi:signal transduction histidine kinase|nr:ATP-binding protein [Pyrinomonadaceae bacterium]